MFFGPYLGIGCGVGGLPRTWYTSCLCSFSPEEAQKQKFPKFFFDIVTTQNHHPSDVKHVLDSICAFFSLFGYWACAVGGGGGSQGAWYTTYLCNFAPLTLGTSKIELSETIDLYVLTT